MFAKFAGTGLQVIIIVYLQFANDDNNGQILASEANSSLGSKNNSFGKRRIFLKGNRVKLGA